jgi:hypothetical protein
MGYNEIWIGVYCEECHQPILVFNEAAWERMTVPPLTTFGKFSVHCSHQECSYHLGEYLREQFVLFRVEQILRPQ